MTPRPRPRLSDYPGIYPAGLVLVVLLTATCLVCCGKAQAADPSDVPRSLLAAMLHEESSSHYRQDGSIRYVNQKRGRDGERGPFQILPSTARQYGFSPSLCEADPAYAEMCARHILARYFVITNSWSQAAAAWHRGLGGRHSEAARAYARRVTN